MTTSITPFYSYGISLKQVIYQIIVADLCDWTFLRLTVNNLLVETKMPLDYILLEIVTYETQR